MIIVYNIIKGLKNRLLKYDIHKIVTAVFAQGLLSISNFTIGFIIAKYASKDEYGLYVLLFSFVGIICGYHNAIVSDPLLVLANGKDEPERNNYVASLSVLRIYLFVPVVIIFTACLVIYYGYISPQYNYIYPCLYLGFAAYMFSTKEFYRTIQYTLLNAGNILIMDLFVFGSVACGALFVIFTKHVTALTGLFILSVGYIGSYLYGKSKNPYKRKSKYIFRKVLDENLSYAKWLFVGIHSSMIQNRSYIYIVSALMGLAVLADVAASRLFWMPMILLKDSIARIMIAKGSIMISEGRHRELRRFYLAFILFILLILFIYILFLYLIFDVLIDLLGSKYSNILGLVVLWGVYVLISAVKSGMAASNVAYKKFKELAIYDVIGAAVVLVSCYILVKQIGAPGSVMALIVGEIFILILYAKLFLSSYKESAS